jgi:hypothetical protein
VKRKKPKARRKSSAYRAIDNYAEWCNRYKPEIRRITVALTERYTRTVLGLRAKAPLAWRGLALQCIGSPAVREREARGVDSRA